MYKRQPLEAPIWERIKETQAKKDKKKFFYNWSLNGLLILFSTIGIYAIVTTIEPNENLSNAPLQDVEITNPKNSAPSDKATLTTSYQNEEQFTKQEEKVMPDYRKEKVKIDKKTIKQNPKPISVSTVNQESSTETPVNKTVKMYYYYNSKDGQEFKSPDKKVIDSIIKANKVITDSIR